MKKMPCPVCGSKRFLVVVRKGVDYEYGVRGDFQIVKCQSCGLVHLNPRPALKEVISYYPKTYHAYQKPTQHLMFRLMNGVRWLTRANQYLRLIGKSGRILDVGCGDGEVLEELQKRGLWELWGLDFNEGVIKTAKKKGLRVYAGTIESVRLPKDYFDLIIMNHLVEHLENPLGTMRRARELLRKGGFVVGQLPNIDCWEYPLFGEKWAGFHIPRHLQMFSKKTLGVLFQKAGFKHIQIGPAFHPGQWPLSLENLLVSKNPGLRRINGKTPYYNLAVLSCAPLVIMEYLFRKASIMNFVARK
jgi:SAM-dependent methyltransferase